MEVERAAPAAILAALPSTMRDLAVATGVKGEALWGVARAMRRQKFIQREKGEDGVFMYSLGKVAMPEGWMPTEAQLSKTAPRSEVNAADLQARKEARAEKRRQARLLHWEARRALEKLHDEEGKAKKERKWHTILLSIEGWPDQDPGRAMIWDWRSSAKSARAELERVRAKMPEIDWHIELLTDRQQRAVANKPFSVRAYRARMEAARAS